MSIASGITLFGRTVAEGLMESTCVITRASPGVPAVDPATALNNTVTATIYSGVCRLRFPTVRPEQELVEGQSIVRDRGILLLPVLGGSADVRADDRCVVTLSPLLDPGTVVTVRVEAPFTQTHSTARRFPVEVLS